ncbi:MAG TPA: VOC family protein [Telluria sp.]|jgi:hypothetical protein
MHAWLKTAIPKLASLDIARSVAFFGMLGFRPVLVDTTVAMLERDAVDLHFWLTTDPTIPQSNGCRVHVDNIEALYQEYLALDIVHPADLLSDKAWGLREFSIIDVDGNVLTFAAQIPDQS